MGSGLWERENYGVRAEWACWSMFGMAAIIVGLRVFCRAVYRRRATGNGLGLDDYITLFCMVVFLVTCIFVTISSHHGLGRHIASLSTEQIKQSLKWSLITNAVLVWTFSLPKFAIISTLQRILCPGIKTTILFWTLALSCQACILATSVWWFKQCDPVERNWDLSIEGKCADISILKNLGYFTSAYSSFLDLFFAIYPAPFIMRLNMPLKTRLAFASAMGLSVLGCFVSLYKLIILRQVFEIMETDPTYPVPYLGILGFAEGFILIVCASIPTLGPLYRLARGRPPNGENNFPAFADASHQLPESSNNLQHHHRDRNAHHHHGLPFISATTSNLFRSKSFKSFTFSGNDDSSPTGDDGTGKPSSSAESLHLRPSFDAIPLVTTVGKASDSFVDPLAGRRGVHLTTEVSVVSTPTEETPGLPAGYHHPSPGRRRGNTTGSMA